MAVDLEAYRAELDRILASVDRLADAEVRAALVLLNDTRRQIIERMVAAAAGQNTYSTTVLATLLQDVDRIGAEYDARLRRHMTAALRAAWEYGAQALPEAMRRAGIEVGFRIGLDSRLLDIASQLTAGLVQNVSQTMIAGITREIRLGTLGGLSVTQTMAKVRALLAAEPRTGLGSIAYQAERIVRTEIMRAYSLANEARTREAQQQIPGMRKYWLATPDARTRDDHLRAWERYRPGGSIGPIPIDDDYIVGGERAKYPYDPRLSARQTINCRCRNILVHPDWEESAQEEAA